MCAAVLAAFEKRAEALGTRFVRVPDRCWALETELILTFTHTLLIKHFPASCLPLLVCSRGARKRE